MVSTVALAPMQTTNAAGTFNTQSYGQIQGVALDDPAMRYQLAGGYLDPTETLPMWGGVGILSNLPMIGAVTNPDVSLGGKVGRATALTGSKRLAAFSVFNQAHHMMITPGNDVPLAIKDMGVHFYKLGSLARIPVKCAPGLTSLDDGPISADVSWDYQAQELVPGLAAWAQLAITSQTYDNTTGIVSVVSAAHPFGVGSVIEQSGAVPSNYNGTKTILTAADNTHYTYQLAPGLGITSPASTPGVILAGGGLLPVKVLEIIPAGNMTVSYDADTGIASWDRNGAIAIIQI